MLRRYLNDGARAAVDLGPGQRVVGLIAPHAGYVYSGAVAGRAWALAAKDASLRTVIVLGPSHHRARTFAATVNADVYRTPVGDVPIASDVIAQLLQDPSGLVKIDTDVLAPEHSVDVQIPFIKVALPTARVVPLVVPLLPTDRLEALAALLYRVLAHEPGVLVVASSDLSHFYDYASANQLDSLIEQEIVAGDVSSLVAHHDERRGPCGVAPIAVLLAYVKRLGPPSKTIPLERINSGDTPEGDKSRVVGYLAAALTAGTAGD